jgi:hypothetical protein
MSNKGDFDRKDLNTFKMLMMYLNPIGSVGTNVDMYSDDIEYFDDVFFSTKGEEVRPPRMFKQFLEKVLLSYGNLLYQNTNKQDNTFVCDIIIDPSDKKIILTPKYWNYDRKRNKIPLPKDSDHHFRDVIENNIPKLRDGRPYSLYFDFVGEGMYFRVEDVLLHSEGTTISVAFNRDNVDNEIFITLRDFVGPDDDMEYDGMLKFTHEGDSTLILNHTEKKFLSGESIIITKEDFMD